MTRISVRTKLFSFSKLVRRFRRFGFVCGLAVLTMQTGICSAQDPPSQPMPNPDVVPAPTPGDIPDCIVIPNATVAPPATNTPAAIEQTQPRFFVRAETDRPSREYYDGEQIVLKIVCELDAYIYVLYTQSDGQTYVMFPNSGAPVGKIAAKQTVQIPAEKDAFRWTVDAPFGKEKLKIIGSTVRIPALEKPELRRKHASPFPPAQIEQVVNEIKSQIPVDQWTESTVELTTIAGANPHSPHVGKRYGAFFSVPFQLSTKLHQLAEMGGMTTSNLGGPPLCDQLLMHRTLSQGNGLDDSLLYPDPKTPYSTLAHRKTIKTAITETLPAVSKPGDTVIIFFSGHGGSFRDPKHGNSQRSYIVPCDMVTLDGLMAMRKLKRENRLPDHVQSFFASAEKLLLDANLRFDPDSPDWAKMTDEDRVAVCKKAQDLFIEKTAITTEEFSHWLDLLPERRVVVLLDACMSGGFAKVATNHELKGLPTTAISQFSTDPRDFQFLKPQLDQLKLLGGINTALITAAREDQPSLQWRYKSSNQPETNPTSIVVSEIYRELIDNEDFAKTSEISKELPPDREPISVFTYYMAQALLTSTKSLDVEHASRECAVAMNAYFNSEPCRSRTEQVNEELKKTKHRLIAPHQPVFFDYCQPKALLKP